MLKTDSQKKATNVSSGSENGSAFFLFATYRNVSLYFIPCS